MDSKPVISTSSRLMYQHRMSTYIKQDQPMSVDYSKSLGDVIFFLDKSGTLNAMSSSGGFFHTKKFSGIKGNTVSTYLFQDDTLLVLVGSRQGLLGALFSQDLEAEFKPLDGVLAQLGEVVDITMHGIFDNQGAERCYLAVTLMTSGQYRTFISALSGQSSEAKFTEYQTPVTFCQLSGTFIVQDETVRYVTCCENRIQVSSRVDVEGAVYLDNEIRVSVGTAPLQQLLAYNPMDEEIQSHLLAITEDGNVFQVLLHEAAASTIPLGKVMPSCRLDGCVDSQGGLHLLASARAGRLYHANTVTDDHSTWTTLTPIQENVGNFALLLNNSGHVQVYYSDLTHGDLASMVIDGAAGSWIEQEVLTDLADKNQFEKYHAYSTDIRIVDQNDLPCSQAEVLIRATGTTELFVNGVPHTIDQSTPLTVPANEAGMLTVSQAAHGLSVSDLIIQVPSIMSSNQELLLRQNADVVQQLKTTTASGLQEAKDESGNYLLSEDIRSNPKRVDDLAVSIAKAAGLVRAPTQLASSVMMVNTKSFLAAPCSSIRQQVPSHPLELACSLTAPQAWHIVFAEDGLHYQALNSDVAERKYASLLQQCVNANGVFSWLSSFMDFCKSVKNKVVKVVENIVATVAEGVRSIFKFIYDGIEYIYDTVIKLANEAMNLVQTYWEAAKVEFYRLFGYVGFLFSWSDILRAKEAIRYTLDSTAIFTKGSVEKFKTLIGQTLDQATSDIGIKFDSMVNRLDRESVYSTRESKKKDTALIEAHAQNNPAMAVLLDGMRSGSKMLDPVLAETDDFIEKLKKDFDNMAERLSKLDAFSKAINEFKKIFTDKNCIVLSGLKGILRIFQGLIQASLQIVHLLSDVLFDSIRALIDKLWNTISQKINIPLISGFYKSISGNTELSLLDIIALIIAIPSTALYKALVGRAPLKDEAALTEFKNAWSGQSLLQRLHVNSTAAMPESRTSQEPIPKAARLLIMTIGAVSSFIYGFLSSINDAAGALAPKVLSGAILVAEFCCVGFSIPWLIDKTQTEALSPFENTNGAVQALWYMSILGLAIDLLGTIFFGNIPENSNEDVGVITVTLFGVLYAVWVINFAVQDQGKSIASVVGYCCTSVTCLAKLALLNGFNKPLYYLPQAAVALVDYLLALAIAGTSIAALVQEINSKPASLQAT